LEQNLHANGSVGLSSRQMVHGSNSSSAEINWFAYKIKPRTYQSSAKYCLSSPRKKLQL
jgi:hypothetical protein